MNRTWVLKVSIHCEGCKKKIKKVLQKVEGVYTIDIDSKQNTVTVNGDVDAESLIRRLLKYGKHAELLPEKNNSTANSATAAAAAAAGGDDVKAKSEEKDAVVLETEQKQNAEQGKAAVRSETPPEGSGELPVNSSEEEAPKLEKPATADAEREEKGKDVQGEENRGHEGAAGAITGRTPANHFMVEPQPAAYTMSYSTIQPSTSYAFYEPPPASYGYAAYPPPSGYSPEYYSSESYYGSMEPTASSAGSYDMFNEENPNACNLM